jgi:hypothetical protein
MDLIVIANGTYILHLIDMFTRYSVACVRYSKKKDVIADAIMKIWISYFGKPCKFLADNGGEFANDEYSNMCEAFGIDIMKTAAESPWSNGLCERHNGVLKESVLKTVEDSKCTLETAVAWAVSSKNSLHGHNGYSPNTLVFGKNPNFPSVMTDKLPALTAENLSDTVENNLKAMRVAREGFIQAEASERIKRALSHNIRSSSEAQFVNGEKVFFKRRDNKRWHGPGTVIGQEGKQVLVKNGGELIRVHVSRLTHVHDQELQIEGIVDSNEGCGNMPLSHTAYEGPNPLEETMEHQDDSSVIVDNEVHLNPMEETEIGQAEAVATNEEVTNEERPKVYPRVDTNIMYKLPNSAEWHRGYVDNRSGAIRYKGGAWRRVRNLDTDDSQWFDFTTDVVEWEPIPADVLITSNDKESILTAKIKEIENWENNQVFEEVSYVNQHVISTRWVISTKEKAGSFVTKARLVARGFEDDAVTKEGVDSPTCSKETVRITMSIMAMKGWACNALDVKTAFLQGNPLQRDVFIKPPKEANTEKIWKLRKAVYGLNEASRSWYNRVENELTKIGFTRSKYDEALFYNKEGGQLEGVVAIHVDDFLFGGTTKFHKTKMSKVRTIFEIGTETSTPMKYLGSNIEQDGEFNIMFSQTDYIKDVIQAELKSSKDKDRLLSGEEQYHFRAICGQLNWIASQSRPDIAFDVCQLSTKLNSATIRDLIHANKVLKKVKNPAVLKFGKLHPPIHLLAYCDASYGNLSNGSSQGGYIIFLTDEGGYTSPICWSSRKLRRVCRSTLTAETMAMLDAIDASIWLSHIIAEVADCDLQPIEVKTDNMSLVESVHSTTAVEEKRLRVEIASIRESIRKKEVNVEWVDKEKQLADVLTKQGADSVKLMTVLHNGHL